VTSRTSADFRRDLAQLPPAIRRQVRDAYRLFAQNPRHPGLKFKKLPPHEDIWSVRINNDYRAIGRNRGDIMLWFFVGTHADYEKLIARF
jgi:mRNA-degrading endonuclease RelE of RelBE toxin-antitoxin system